MEENFDFGYPIMVIFAAWKCIELGVNKTRLNNASLFIDWNSRSYVIAEIFRNALQLQTLDIVFRGFSLPAVLDKSESK